MSAESDTLVEQVTEALRVVIDPELGYNIVDLGLVYSIKAAEGGVVDIVMTTTTRGCPATAFLKEGARDGAWAVPGVEFVDVTLTYEPHWTPEMMTEGAKQHLGFA
jgi:metal-sulfur cluster biosynthetic enzyme